MRPLQRLSQSNKAWDHIARQDYDKALQKDTFFFQVRLLICYTCAGALLRSSVVVI